MAPTERGAREPDDSFFGRGRSRNRLAANFLITNLQRVVLLRRSTHSHPVCHLDVRHACHIFRRQRRQPTTHRISPVINLSTHECDVYFFIRTTFCTRSTDDGCVSFKVSTLNCTRFFLLTSYCLTDGHADWTHSRHSRHHTSRTPAETAHATNGTRSTNTAFWVVLVHSVDESFVLRHLSSYMALDEVQVLALLEIHSTE